MKVYTKTGDKGETSLIGGVRVNKDHVRIEAYGTVDELNSWIGLLRDQKLDQNDIELLLEVQDRLFTMGSILASAEGSKMKLPQLKEEDLRIMETRIDELDKELPEMRNFVLPGGLESVSYCHISRCVCRRAERRVITLFKEDLAENLIIVRYLNRLSDYLFVLSRYIGMKNNATETVWHPRMD